jgi:predicted ester cyclase
MRAEDNGALVRRSIEELWNEGRLDRVEQLFTSYYALHVLHEVDAAGVGGPLGVRQRVAMWRATLRNVHVTIEDLVVAGDRVVIRWTGHGTDSEDHWWGQPATGKRVRWAAITISRVADGKIAEEWLAWDRLDLWQQLEAAPPTRALFAPGAAAAWRVTACP